jgi:TRAP-type C4-dicarboxylate transport system permease small subunit
MTLSGSWQQRLRRVLTRLVEAQLLVSELLVASLAVFVSLDALLRWLANWSFLIVDEVGGYVLVIIAFLGMSIALHEGALFRVEAFYDRLSERAKQRLQVVFDLFSLAFSALLLWELYGLVMRSFERDIVAPTMLRTPLWIPQAAMVIGALALTFVLLLHVAEGLAGVKRDPHPSEGD